MLGTSALAMWWDIAPDVRADFEHWHTHEHFPERLGIPGFLRASRWSSADGGEGFFVLYELQGHEVLASPDYLARLNAPSPWSRRLMPHHRNMVRSQCRVLESRGAAIGRQVLTIRLSPAPGADDQLRASLRALAGEVAQRPGLGGLHLLRHDPPVLVATEEQKIRGLRDGVADWVLLATGYEPAALRELAAKELSGSALAGLGAAAAPVAACYALSATAVPADTR